MATITVSTPGEIALREALNEAANNGDAVDQIVFASNLAGSTIRLTSTLDVNVQAGEFLFFSGDADGDGVADITITGDVNGNNVADAGDVRILNASGAGSLSLTNLTLTNGFEQGSDGGSKGDGVYENGGDATAAIYSNIAALSLNRVVISNSRATGGEFGRQPRRPTHTTPATRRRFASRPDRHACPRSCSKGTSRSVEALRRPATSSAATGWRACATTRPFTRRTQAL